MLLDELSHGFSVELLAVSVCMHDTTWNAS
jgi:hypothetical protein